MAGLDRNSSVRNMSIARSVESGHEASRPRFLWCLRVVLIAALAVGGASTARAATIMVTTTGDPGPSGTCSLRQAITNANQSDQAGSTNCAAGTGNDEIQFASGVTGTITLSSSLPSIEGTLTISGPTASPPAITIDGGGKMQVVQNGGTLTLQYLTIANGNTTDLGGGGAIFSDGSLTINNCIFLNNKATNANSANGGAIATSPSDLTIMNSTFSGNQAIGSGDATGGAISCNCGLTVANSTFSDNQVSSSGSYAFGGAIENSQNAISVNNSTFTDNEATAAGGEAAGGAIWVIEDSSETITNSTFSGNQATYGVSGGGGAIDCDGMYVTNSTFSGNLATGTGGAQGIGGAIHMESFGGLYSTAVTFSGNQAIGGSPVGGAIGGDYPSYFI